MSVWFYVGTGIAAIVAFAFWFFFKATTEQRLSFFEDVKSKLSGFLLDLILSAEQAYGSGMGQFKKSFVINMILNCEFYKGLPMFIQKLITYDLLSSMIDTICDTIFKKAQASNANLQKILK